MNSLVSDQYYNLNKRKYLLYGLIITVCLQMTDVKFMDIKIGELIILSFIVTHIAYLRTVHKFLFWFILIFFCLLIKTLMQDIFTTFYINTTLSILKLPGIISIARFVEIFCCFFFTILVVKLFQSFNYINENYEFVYRLLKYNIYIPGFFFILFYFIYRFSFMHVNATTLHGFLIYDTTGRYAESSFRLNGFYVEGGPMGLFYSYIYIIYEWVLKKLKRNDIIGKWVIILIIVLASSKAGYSMLIVFWGIKSLLFVKKKFTKEFMIIFIPLFLIISFIFLYNILYSYISTIGQELTTVAADNGADEIDGAMSMGRVSGLVIAPNMIIHNWFTGIGFGNYPLLRNNPLYLGYFPTIPTNLWDSSGLGGIFDFFLEGGILFFILFVFIFIKIFKEIRTNENTLYLFYSFVAPFIFGVQLYFFYPWLSLAFIIIFIKKNIKYDAQ